MKFFLNQKIFFNNFKLKGGNNVLFQNNEEENEELINHFDMFPHKELFEAIIDLIRHWRWGRLIIVFSEPESKKEEGLNENNFLIKKRNSSFSCFS